MYNIELSKAGIIRIRRKKERQRERESERDEQSNYREY